MTYLMETYYNPDPDLLKGNRETEGSDQRVRINNRSNDGG
jgi:hypothetical protein